MILYLDTNIVIYATAAIRATTRFEPMDALQLAAATERGNSFPPTTRG